MPYSLVETPALGDTNAFPVPFPFLKRPDIHAYVDEVEVRPLTWLTSNLVRLPVAAGDLAGKVVRIQRITPNQDAVVTFKPGQLDQGDLNRAVLQLLYVSQEAADRVAALPTPLPGNRYDFKGRRAVNLGDPVDPQDAATAAWTREQTQVAIEQALLADLLSTTSAAFRILFARFLAGLPNQPPPGDLQPWLNGGLLAVTDGEIAPTSPQQAAFNATFGPLFVAYLQNRPTVPSGAPQEVYLNGGLVALAP
ncbi:phage tail fiber protein [Methylobacterium ajmalii]|jgi:hypothetical protein|uniref:phage tail fiber domain-containing protein n=1 Tax=Methylobacterium ajmalii TaxID=2738439 RepID=UPI00190E35D5|nr:phage tail fiber protein [Methylobacterium ajmalii]MBK3400417.1 hypothetical protein [Methylobacterium ajmalii]MBK3407541.1 hypothetical protein [Methylobacterium ajmalii]MBK3422111.1 hypothetical protein [Methylobacterium ajmalii]MBZ6415619.1 hypothetical protein [Methylobacterium sp.]